MKKSIFKFKRLPMMMMVACALSFQSCDKDKANEEGGNENNPSEAKEIFHIAKQVGKEKTLITKHSDLKQGQVDASAGFSIDHESNRVYSSSDGKILYNLKYKKGIIQKYVFTFDKKDEYKMEKELDISGTIGDKNLRWKVVNDQLALAYTVPKNAHSQKEMHILKIDLPNLTISEKVVVPFPAIDFPNLPNTHIWRVDNPTVHNGKIYMGLAIRGHNGNAEINSVTYGTGALEIAYPASVLILDFPSFKNPKIVSSSLPNAVGETYGYRTPSFCTSENGDVYNVTMQHTHILKMKNGEYDNSYDFDLTKALGLNNKIGGTGIFYAGNGIAFVPYYEQTQGKKDAEWHIARVDLNKKTAIKMNFPTNLNLTVYQNAKKGKDGKIYFALTPRSGNGKVYIVDPTKEDANAFTEGATLEAGANVSYVGVY